MALWGLWFLLGFFSFLTYELWAYFTRKAPTLSRTIWRLTKSYPLFPFALGAVTGGLAIHFFGWLPACVP